MRRLLAVVALGLVAAVAVASPASAQPAPDIEPTALFTPDTTPPGTTVTLTGTYTLVSAGGSSFTVGLVLTGTSGAGSFTSFTTTGALTGCAIDGTTRALNCTWTTPQTGDTTTIVATVNVAASAIVGSTWQGNPTVNGTVDVEAGDQLLILPAPTTVAPTTTPTTIVPTTAPTTPTTAAPPTSGVVSTSATSDPTALPTTGTSDTVVLFAVIALAVGVFVLMVARKFHPLDERT